MKSFVRVAVVLALITALASAQSTTTPPALVLVTAVSGEIDHTHTGAEVEFSITNPPRTAETMVVMDADGQPIAVSANKKWTARAFVYGGGAHYVSAEVQDAKGNLVGSTGPQLVVFEVTSKFKPIDNGITVGVAKQFDDRSLSAMLRDVEAALRMQQGTVFKSVADTVGRFQGQTADRTSFGVTATTLPLPGTESDTTTKTTDTGATGSTEVKTDTTGTTTTTKAGNSSQNVETTATDKVTRAAVTPNTGQAPPPGTNTFSQISLGPGAESLLNEQANLNAQYTSLRLLLQRSLSDRVVLRPNGTSEPRSQTVYGFQISIDPTRQYRDAVAEAIVNVTLPPGDLSGHEAPRLITLMPKEKTYNVAEATSRSRAFSLGGIVQVLNVGAAVNRSREALYVVQDTDTVALERTPVSGSARTATSFAWQFRPVLGRRVVTPGSRQVFAVLALPASVNETWDGVVSVTTQWRRYDRRTKTAGAVIPESISRQEPYLISVSRLREQETAVASAIENIDLRFAGNAAIVTADGHFPDGTAVSVADTIIDSAANGMLLKTPRRMSFIVSAERLFFSPTFIDTFGVATPLRMPGGDKVRSFSVVAAGQEERFAVYVARPKLALMQFELSTKNVLDLLRYRQSEGVKLNRPLVLIGHSVFGISDAPINQIVGSADCDPTANAALCRKVDEAKKKGWSITKLSFDVPAAVTQDARVVRVIDPFFGDGSFAEEPITFARPNKVASIGDLQFVNVSNTEAQLALSGKLLTQAEDLRLRVGSADCTRTDVSESVAFFTCSTPALATATRAVVRYKESEPKLLPIPPLPSLRVQVLRQEAIREGEVRPVRLEGNDLSTVSEARYNGVPLHVSHDSGSDDTLYIDVSAAVTASPGDKLIQLLLKDGHIVQTVLTVNAKAKSAT